jgi:hypothetical protein
MANKELQDLLTRIKEISAALLETSDNQEFNEENVSKLCEEIDSLTKIGGDIFPNLFSMSSDTTTGNINLKLNAKQVFSTGTQTELKNHSDQFDRSTGLARILCHALSHATSDKKNLVENDVSDNFPLALTLENDKYFVGFCEHTQEGETITSKPTYGLLFTPDQFMSESLYVGKVNIEGQHDTENGLYFQDLYFEDENL